MKINRARHGLLSITATLLLLLLFTPVLAEAQLEVTVGNSRIIKPYFIGLNTKMPMTDPWNDPNQLNNLIRSNTGMIRYPGGTIANHFDWVQGHKNGGNYSYLPSHVAVGSNAAGSKVSWVVNMLEHDLQYNIDGLISARGGGSSIEFIEMGNEFYLNGKAEYVARFPSGVEYGQECQIWIAALKAEFPGVKCAVVGTRKTSTRSATWNSEVFANCNNFDAVVEHFYTQSNLEPDMAADSDAWGSQKEQDDQWAAFNAPGGVAKMLGQPYNDWQQRSLENAYPADARIWLTEWNLKDEVGAVRNTWAHGLFLANDIYTFLSDPRIDFINMQQMRGGQKAAFWKDEKGLDGLLVNHNQGDMTTTANDMTAQGKVASLFGRALGGNHMITSLDFENDPMVSVPNEPNYPALIGYKAGNGTVASAILINFSSAPYDINTIQIGGPEAMVKQIAAEPNTFWPNEATILESDLGTLTPALSLPGYSITTISGIAMPMPPLVQKPIEDAHVNKNNPTTNYNQSTLQLRSMASNFTRISFLKFEVNDLPRPVTNAALKLYSQTQDGRVDAKEVTDSNWAENSITWDTMPPVGDVINSSIAEPNSWFQIDVTSYITGNGVYTIALETPVNVLGKLSSSETDTNSPILEITLAANDPDINSDGDINFEDFEYINRYWMTPCLDPNWCEGADLNKSGLVDFLDVKTFTQSWDSLP